jgi:SpoVK/Ycf46/Vps4 family AAA+-type ATPase
MGYRQRADALRRGLGHRNAGLAAAIQEAAYRFRFEAETIDAVCAGLRDHRGQLTQEVLFAALRNAAPATAQTLAEIVTPRFDANELVLPPGQQRQLDEIETAMRSLARVHFCWGTARVWNDSGVSVLFAGPSGTGKTMAAEVLAGKLDLPMYRINLAQVVNKYIGETEKNLERVFDSVDA